MIAMFSCRIQVHTQYNYTAHIHYYEIWALNIIEATIKSIEIVILEYNNRKIDECIAIHS